MTPDTKTPPRYLSTPFGLAGPDAMTVSQWGMVDPAKSKTPPALSEIVSRTPRKPGRGVELCRFLDVSPDSFAVCVVFVCFVNSVRVVGAHRVKFSPSRLARIMLVVGSCVLFSGVNVPCVLSSRPMHHVRVPPPFIDRTCEVCGRTVFINRRACGEWCVQLVCASGPRIMSVDRASRSRSRSVGGSCSPIVFTDRTRGSCSDARKGAPSCSTSGGGGIGRRFSACVFLLPNFKSHVSAIFSPSLVPVSYFFPISKMKIETLQGFCCSLVPMVYIYNRSPTRFKIHGRTCGLSIIHRSSRSPT